MFTGCAEKSLQDDKTNDSIVNAVLNSGSYFTSENNFKSELPLVFDDKKNGCSYLGNPIYSISQERVFVSLYQKVCFDGENVVNSYIEGFVFENKMSGISTEVNYTNGVVAILKAGKNVELGISKTTNLKAGKNVVKNNDK